MHYKNGTEAELGDIVRGKGYNLPYEAQGIVVGLTLGQGSCDIHIATLCLHQPLGTKVAMFWTVYEEHGTCAEFELVYRAPKPTP